MEIEIKAKVKNLTILRQKILSLGAKKIADKHQLDIYLSPSHKSFFKTRHYLRIRQDLLNKTSSFDYHIVRGSGKYGNSEEYEVGVEDGKRLLKILKKLNFTEICRIDKTREVFQYQDFEIVLDEVKKLGTFVEVEIEGSLRDYKKHQAKIIEFLEKLGVKQNQFCQYGGYVEMITGTSARDWKN